jgi:hypothetical protein
MKPIITCVAAIGLILSIATSRAQESLPLPSFGSETPTAPPAESVPAFPPLDNNAPPVPPPPTSVPPPATAVPPPATAPVSPPASYNANPVPPTGNATPPLATSRNRAVPLARNPNQPATDYWSRDARQLDLIRLDQYSDRLATVARHLHADAHRLCRHSIHSASIEAHVDQLDRLQQHLHQLLHEAVATGNYFAVSIGQIQGDVQQVRTLIGQLYHELRHQGIDGARARDQRLMAHMRQIIVQDATPLLQLMDQEVYGYNQYRRTDGCNGGYCPSGRPMYSAGPYYSDYWQAD